VESAHDQGPQSLRPCIKMPAPGMVCTLTLDHPKRDFGGLFSPSAGASRRGLALAPSAFSDRGSHAVVARCSLSAKPHI
jgi:hypothetical protein